MKILKALANMLAILTLVLIFGASLGYAKPKYPLKVVTTLSGYASIAKMVGGDKVKVDYFVQGYQDPHFVRPKPSLANKLPDADLFVSTGLDLELWAPTLVDLSGNKNIRSGQEGYVSASYGIKMREKPQVFNRSEGGVHIYGNPHIQNNPINGKVIAGNIVGGLKKIDPENSQYYQQKLNDFEDEIDRRLFGEKLVKLLGGKTLTKLALSGRLIKFLKTKNYQGKPLIDRLGGWLKQAMVFRDKKIIGYHKNWTYFNQLFGLKMVDYVEPKPGIPPSPKHVETVINKMQKNSIKVILAANYFDENQVRTIARRVGAKVAFVGMDVNGVKEASDFFKLFDHIIGELVIACK